MHQEILGNQSLVSSVCDKAQQLVDQTKDTSLNVYLQSIKDLFENIVIKSQVVYQITTCFYFILINLFLYLIQQ